MANKYAEALYKSIQNIADNTTEALKQTLPEYSVGKIIALQSAAQGTSIYFVQILGQQDLISAQSSLSKTFIFGQMVQVQKLNDKYIILGDADDSYTVDGFFNFYYEKNLPFYTTTLNVFDTSLFKTMLQNGGDLVFIEATTINTTYIEDDQTKLLEITNNGSVVATILLDDIEGDPYNIVSGTKLYFKFIISYIDITNVNLAISVNSNFFSDIKLYVGKSNNQPFGINNNGTANPIYNFYGSVCPTNTATSTTDTKGQDLGSTNFIWRMAYYKGTSTTSARMYKKNIENFTEKYDILFDNLQPRKFQYNFKNSDRQHFGFVVDEVGAALENAELTSNDCGAYQLYDRNDPFGPGGLNYEEFIALNTWQIQKLKTRVGELEAQIQELKNTIQQQQQQQ